MRFFFCCLLTLCSLGQVFANDTIYEQRRLAYIDTALADNDKELVLQAYKGLPLDSAELHRKLALIPVKSTIDFDIVEFVRILYFTNGEYDSLILSNLEPIPFRLTYGDTIRGYWSENHMIMWKSSYWLLHEKYGWDVHPTVEASLKHYLQLKIDHGFYEYFSSTYAPYSLSGILNLVDFVEDTTIRNLAVGAVDRLLKDLLLMVNDQGVFYPVAGRNYFGSYDRPYDHNVTNLIYLLTGRGKAPRGASHGGSFLATSTLFTDDIAASWEPELDFVYHIGHSLDSGFVLNSVLEPVDKTLFQWSSGAYFHPVVAQESATLANDSALWNHVDFKDFGPLSSLPINEAQVLAEFLGAISYSSLNCQADIAIFKKNSVVLSSNLDFWKGKVGYQQYPCVATVGNTAVFPVSGEVKADWDDKSSNHAHEHLPYVEQSHNVALLMYWPEKPNIFLKSEDVALHWFENDFDEIRTDSLWLLGRQDENYVAVRRTCTGKKQGQWACSPVNPGQSWVMVVGDSSMYTDFSNFENIISQSQFTESWSFDSTTEERTYYASVTVDTISIDYAWVRDESTTAIEEPLADESLRVYPNPANNSLNIDLSALNSLDGQLSVHNLMGQQVYGSSMDNNSQVLQLNTSEWPQGMYIVRLEVAGQALSRKVVISR